MVPEEIKKMQLNQSFGMFNYANMRIIKGLKIIKYENNIE